MVNTSGINPTEYNVLVERHGVEDVSAGGVVFPNMTLDRKQAMATKATLLAVSPLAFTYERWPEGARPPQVGDTVILTKAAGVDVEGIDGKTYRLLKDKDIAAVVGSHTSRLEELDGEIDAMNREAANA